MDPARVPRGGVFYVVYPIFLLQLASVRRPITIFGRLIWWLVYERGVTRAWTEHLSRLTVHWRATGRFPRANDHAVGIRPFPLPPSASPILEELQQQQQQKQKQGPHPVPRWLCIFLFQRALIEVFMAAGRAAGRAIQAQDQE